MAIWPDSIWLVGLSAAGKSTVGPLLADRLDYEFIDLDGRIEAERARTVAEIFSEEGEESFRAAEAAVSGNLLGRPRIVVATGGGLDGSRRYSAKRQRLRSRVVTRKP